MPEPVTTIAAVTTLALSGLGWLAVAAAGGAVGNVADRGFQTVMQGIRNRLAGMREAPDGLTVARAVRLAQVHALERVLRDYERSLRLPRVLRPSKTNGFIDRAKTFCASSVGRGVDLAGTLDVQNHAPAVAAANAVLAGPPRGAPSHEQASRLMAIAEGAVLDELRKVTAADSFPRGFEEHFTRGCRGYSSFSTLFRSYLQEQIKSDDGFHRVYSMEILARLDQVAMSTHDAVGRIEADFGALREDMRVGVTDSIEHLAADETLNFAMTDTYFGRRLSTEATFNHARPLVGREELTARMVEESRRLLDSPGAGIVTLSAIGGAGKSRLLIEVARRLESEMNVRWVRDGIEVALNAMSQLPPGPLLLICDDAQRRSDLASLLRLADLRRDRTVVLMSTRPYGRDAVHASLYGANVPFDRLRDMGDLPDVPMDDLVPLVQEELGSEYHHLAPDLLRLAGGSILVALVAARLLRTRELNPQGIVLDPEFRATVLDGFRNEALGAVPGSLDPDAARRVLETLAAVQPILLEDEAHEGALATFVGVDVSTLRRIVAALVDGGVIRSDRSGSRIVPDVLGDHILNSAMVARGRPTALDAEILNALGPAVLVNLVRNVAELDWQRSIAGEPGIVFAGVWKSFTAAFLDASNWSRAEWLGQLHPVAAFQPEAMLRFAKALLDDPGGDDRPHGIFNLRTSSAEVALKLPSLLAIVTQHPDYTAGALDLLWNIGRSDDRATNPYPEHAIRQLTDVVAYSRRRHLWMQEQALDALERWLADPTWSAGPHSPLLAASAVLQTSMMEHSYNDRDSTVTLTRIGVHAGNTGALRLRAISILERVVMETDMRGRHVALAQLLNALHRPDDVLSHEPSVEEEESFRDQYSAVLDAIERVLGRGTDPLALVTIRSDLHRSARFTLLPWKAARMTSVAESIEDSRETRLVRALAHGYSDWDPERVSHEEYAEARAAELRTAADELVKHAGLHDAAAETLSAACDLYDAAGASYEPGTLLYDLVQRHGDLACHLARWSMEKAEEGGVRHPEWLPPLLGALRVVRPSEHEALLWKAAMSELAVLRRAAAAAMYRLQGENRRTELELELTRTLMRDSDLSVVRTALAGLAFMDSRQVELLLPLVSLRGDPAAAERLAETWAMRRGEQLPEPDEATTRHLVSELVEVPDLGRAQWDVSKMLAVMARLHPQAVVDFISQRVQCERAAWASRKEFDLRDRYDAIPYGGFDGLQEALRSSDRYEEVVERLLCSLHTTVDGVSVKNDVAHTVLGALGQWDDVLERIVRGWIANGDCESLRSNAALFAELPRDFTVTNVTFVVDLLKAADACGEESRSAIEDALERGTFANDFEVRSVGEPHPVTLRIASEAEALASQLANEGYAGAAALYVRLASRARDDLEWARQRDERTRQTG